MQTLAVSKSLAIFRLLCIFSLIFSPILLSAQSRSRAKSVKINEAFVIEQDGRSITCALVRSKWLSGKLKSNDRFISDNAKLKSLKRKIKTAREPQLTKLKRKLKRVKTKRKFGNAACKNGPPAAPAPDPLKKLSRPMTKADIQHLFRRAALGYVPDAQMNLGLNYGVSAILNNLFTRRNDVLAEQAARDVLYDNNGNNSTTRVKYYALYKLIYTQNPLLSQLCMVHLHDILSVSVDAVNNGNAYRDLMLRYFDTMCRISEHGSYRQLIKEITLEPAMLRWLDGDKNNKLLPNENYARELMELFTIGVFNKNGQPNYTDLDVATAARSLTGFGVINSQEFGISTIFNFNAFDSSTNKTIFRNTSAAGPAYDWEELIDRIFDHHPNMAYNLALMLAERYVRPDIAKSNPALVAAMANDLKSNDFNVMSTLGRLLESEEFYNPANRHTILRSPAEATIAIFRALRTTGLPLDINPVTVGNIFEISKQGGQELAAPPSVFGWDRDKEFTIGSRFLSMTNRLTTIFGSSTFNNELNPTGWNWKKLYPPGVASPSAAQMVDRLCDLLSISLNSTKRNMLIRFLNTQRRQVNNNGNPYIEDADDPWQPETYSQARKKLSGLLRILLNSTEFKVN